MFSGLNFIYLEFGVDSLEFLFMSSTLVITTILSLCVAYLFSLHLYLISKGVTTLEYMEKYRRDMKKINKDFAGKQNFIKNFKNIMGDNFWTWFFPVDIERREMGYNE
jgi:hypothetical protein